MLRLPFVLILLLLLGPSATFAQRKDTVIKKESIQQKTVDSLTQQMDVVDLVSKILHTHLSSNPDTLNVKAGKLFFALAPAIGYTLEGNWLANVSVNTSFYSANPDSTNLSTFNYGAQYDLNHQITVPITSSIWLRNNKINLLGDWRYYKYPSYTYGLGGNTLTATPDLINYSYVRVYQEILGHFNSFFYAGGGYNYDNHFDIHEIGENAYFDLYNKGAVSSISSGPVLHFMYDSRSNNNNPRNSSYASITYRYNTALLGSTGQWQSAFLEFKKYVQLSPSSSNVLAFWSWNVFTFSGMAPYFDLPSNGWDVNNNSGRGYIQGRFRGPKMLYDEAEYRFQITNNGLLGGTLFTNVESVSQYPDNKFTYIDPAYGFGLRLKMNKYSDVNLCIDYGFGLMGSRGFFFNLGEVF